MKETHSIVPVILCGGSGTRLWPLSRSGFPKQFLALHGTQTLFQEAFLRLAALANEQVAISHHLIVTNEEQRFLALDQLQELQGHGAAHAPIRFLLEPQGKNTAPALTLAAIEATHGGADPILVMTPADQTITDGPAFTKALHQAIALANQDRIVILGITPTKAETGYGYIQVGAADAQGGYPVVQFTEKPNLETATRYLSEGGYYWNGGMFVLKASVWLKALAQFRPDIANATQSAWQDHQQDQLSHVTFIRPNAQRFSGVPAESIDYAVMEQCPRSTMPISMVPLNAGWNDLGAWDAVWQVAKQNADGNATHGDVLTTNSKNTLVIASHRLVSTVGVENLIVIETADAVLVADKNRAQEAKAIVGQLENEGREEKNLHRKVHRPWGWYDSIEEGARFKVKRIEVKPGASLSLQMHHQRAEHWIVVQGVAEVTNGDQVMTLCENQSTYIPLGQKHRLHNPGTIPLQIIEVQSGGYLGEDDIVRFEDTYKRI
jgi:mannose-1-phosphate guanylyltransferase/mannose-6-phosphate isomerase